MRIEGSRHRAGQYIDRMRSVNPACDILAPSEPVAQLYPRMPSIRRATASISALASTLLRMPWAR